jgi:hypothetical protein
MPKIYKTKEEKIHVIPRDFKIPLLLVDRAKEAKIQ